MGPESLKAEAPILHRRALLLRDWLDRGRITAPEFTTLSLLSTLSHRFPRSWPGARRADLVDESHLPFPIAEIPWELEENVARRFEGLTTIGEVINGFSLRSTPLSVNQSLLGWARGQYKLHLLFHIPKPLEVLTQQVKGERCVTVLLKEREMENYVLGERDHLGFAMHDLIHADHFYRANQHHQGQIDFYRLLQRGIKSGAFRVPLENEEFAGEFEYLIADMNAYPVHLMKCLKSALLFYSPSEKCFFEEWIQAEGFAPDFAHALRLLGTDAYDEPALDPVILRNLGNVEG